MTNGDFSPDQKRYLEGFLSGVQSARTARGLAPIGTPPGSQPAQSPGSTAPASEPTGPDAEQLRAQNRFLDAGKKLCNEEKAKREEHPFDMYARMKSNAREGAFPKGVDVFRWKYHGLFYVAPAQDSFMCRLRIPNGILKHWQFKGVSDIARQYGGGYSHVTTRANLQIREIGAAHGIAVLEGLQDIGIVSRGSGADNIRNVTGGATAGIDPQELIDTRPMASAWHHHILNDRSLFGLPRKFNVAFDGGGLIPTLEETNDIGFTACRVGEGAAVAPGIWFRLGLGGITGHQDFARDTGVVVEPDDCVAVADAIVRVFIDHGDRTNRNKARLKYILDDWGFGKFINAVEEKLGRSLARVPPELCDPPPLRDRHGHIGIHPQRQDGLLWLGVALPVGKLTCDQMDGLAAIAGELGDGDIRLTVWQNLLISGLTPESAEEAAQRTEALGLDWRATSVRAGLVACTGSRGCRLAASDTKGHAVDIAEHLDSTVRVDTPINIHLTGCPNSCAQHYVGDIGLVGARVAMDEEGEETVDGYNVVVGGGFGTDAGIGREIFRDVPADQAPALLARMVQAYMDNRSDPQEPFFAFSRRNDIDTLKAMFKRGES